MTFDKRQQPPRGKRMITRALRAAPARFLDVGRHATAALIEWAAKNRPSALQVDADDTRLGFEVLTRIAQHAIVVADARDLIVEWSPGAEDLFGYTALDILGQPLTRLIGAGDRPVFEAEIERTRRSLDHGGRFVLSGEKNDGRPVSLEISLAAWSAKSGQMLGAVLHDVSKQVLAERRLGETERNWRDIAENSSDVLLLLDRAGTVIFANRGPFNRRLEQVIGGSVAELIPDLATAIEPALQAVFDSGLSYQHEGRITSPDGRSHWCWCRFAPQREDGDVVRAVLSISDIGDRIERDLAVHRLAGIVERTRDAVLTTDTVGRIRSWNSGAELLWGWSEIEVTGRNVAMLCPPESMEEQRIIFGRLRDGRHVNPYDAFALAKNRRRIPVSVSVAATRNETGQFEGISAVVRDMSYHQELQDALQKAKSVAETANQLKSEFIANMSHEVRTPLNGVVGMADLLRSTPLTPDQQGYVATLLEASQALRVIVDDVLDFSKIEAGQLRIESVEFDLISLATAAIDMFRQTAIQNGIELRLVVPTPPMSRVVGDPNRIRQVLTNLLSNAVKFTKRGGVELRISVKKESGPNLALRVEIEDTGVGINPEAKRVIFQPFAQADGSITRRFGGTGLGLSICRKLMELMGGEIGFRSEVDVGSTFWFEVELGKAKSQPVRKVAAHSSLPPKKKSTPWKILVAEDNLINQKVVCAMLQGLGCSVDIANDGREAFEMWEKGSYDLILMDCQMPIMSGFETAAAIRDKEGLGNERIPIIALTAQAYAQDRERCTRAGMDDHLAKPLTKGEIKNALAKWLQLDRRASVTREAPPVRAMTLDRAMLDRLESELGDEGKEILAGLIEAFFIDFQRALERLAEYVEAARWERVVFEAHRLRSSTANLAAVNMALLCTGLEECGERADAPLAAELMLRLQEEFQRVREALTAYSRSESPRVSRETREMPDTSHAGEPNNVPS